MRVSAAALDRTPPFPWFSLSAMLSSRIYASPYPEIWKKTSPETFTRNKKEILPLTKGELGFLRI